MNSTFSNKAEVAAAALTSIFPLVNANGLVMDIPMLGQQIVDEQVIASLETLICESDVIFLVTDSRESRWLPLVLGMHHKKVVLGGIY